MIAAVIPIAMAIARHNVQIILIRVVIKPPMWFTSVNYAIFKSKNFIFPIDFNY